MTTEKAGKKPARVTLSLKPAGEMSSGPSYLRALIFGKSGAGKTHLVSKAQNVAVCLVEPQGWDTIRTNHKHAIVPASEGYNYLRTMDEVREILLMAVRGKLREAGIDTLAIDSLTEIQQMMMDEILAKKPKNSKSYGVFTKRDYGTLVQMMRKFLRLLRTLDLNVAATALADWQFDEEAGHRTMAPLLKGSIQKEVNGYFNLVGYAYRRQDENSDDGVARYVMVDGDERYSVKPFGRLTGVLEPDFDLWVRVSVSEDPEDGLTATIEGAPLPSTSIGGGEARQGARFGGNNDDDDDN